MIRNVTGCDDCPFYVDLYSFCNLDVEIEIEYWNNHIVPENCPLKKETYICVSLG